MITIMTALEAIPKISELLARLIKLSKDREAAALIQQIQEHQLVVHQGLMDAQTQNLDLKRKLLDMERDRAQAIAKLQAAQHTAQGDICPFCRQPTLQLLEIRPSENPHLGALGFKERHYRCSNPSCGKTYDKEEGASE